MAAQIVVCDGSKKIVCEDPKEDHRWAVRTIIVECSLPVSGVRQLNQLNPARETVVVGLSNITVPGLRIMVLPGTALFVIT